MSPSVKMGLIAGFWLALFSAAMIFSYGGAVSSDVAKARVSLTLGAVIVGVVVYALVRSFRKGVVVLYGRTGVSLIRRSESPVGFWILFTVYLLLVPTIIWLVKERLHELHFWT
jgi:hypothetical protein